MMTQDSRHGNSNCRSARRSRPKRSANPVLLVVAVKEKQSSLDRLDFQMNNTFGIRRYFRAGRTFVAGVLGCFLFPSVSGPIA